MYLSGYGLLDIAQELNKFGFKTKRNKAFGKNSIYDILSNVKYTGTYIHNKAYKHNSHINRDDAFIIENAIPAIISKEDFQMIQNKRKTNVSGEASAKRIYLLSGLIKCGKCGGNYTGTTSTKERNGNKYQTGYYKCSHRNKLDKCDNIIISQEKIENCVIDLLSKKLLNSTDIDNVINKVNVEYQKIYEESFDTIKQLQNELKEKETQINNVTSVIASGVSSQALLEKLQQLESQKKLIEEDLSFSKNISKTEFKVEDIKELLSEDVANLNKSQESKAIIKKWVKKIEVYESEIIINFSFGTNSVPCLVAGGRFELSTPWV